MTQITPPRQHTKSQRYSNFELIRIIAMSMIITGHLLGHALELWTGVLIHNIAVPWIVCGVNMFFMLSGWFTIKLSYSRVVRLAIMVCLFDLINVVLCMLVGLPVSLNSIGQILLFPISRSNYWFIAVYLILMVCAPIINKGVETMSVRQLRGLAGVLTFFIAYSCGLGHNMSNPYGLSFLTGLYMYVMGMYLHREPYLRMLTAKRLLLGFVAVSSLLSALYCITDYYSLIMYNSIFVIVASVCLFGACARLQFKSGVVNSLSTAALGCYLLQDGLFGWRYLYGHIAAFAECHAPCEVVLYCAAMFIGFWAASWVLTKAFDCVTPRAVAVINKITPNGVHKIFASASID